MIEGGWGMTDVLSPSYPFEPDGGAAAADAEAFGTSVAAAESADGSELVVAVGAPAYDGSAGAVYIFTRPTKRGRRESSSGGGRSELSPSSGGGAWTLRQRLGGSGGSGGSGDLLPLGLSAGERFGAAVSLHGDRLLVGRVALPVHEHDRRRWQRRWWRRRTCLRFRARGSKGWRTT